jgi:hypothetical protein
MKDDYLWDRTGEPDPDIQSLEQSLGRFRHQPERLGAAFDRQLLPRRINWRPRLAAAAAVLLMALAGVWVVRNQRENRAQQPVAQGNDYTKQPQANDPPGDNKPGDNKPDVLSEAPALSGPVRQTAKAVVIRRKPVEPRKAQPKEAAPETYDPVSNTSEVAVVQPIVIPFVDIETSKHIERSQMLLRSFRNMDDTDRRDDSEIAYEKQQSRGLLYQNIVLRRDAEARGNMPVEDLLGSLEPFLIDIANLPEKPSKDEMVAIKERMRKKEILSSLQIYSAPTLSQVIK